MFDGGWGPAFPEEGDVGRKYFNYPVLMAFYGVTKMVMGAQTPCRMPFKSVLDGSMRAPCGTSFGSVPDGGAHALRILSFESAPEYGDFRCDTFLLVCP